MSGLILALNRITYKIPMILRIKESNLLKLDTSFKVNAVISSLKITIAGMVIAVLYNRLHIIEFIGFVTALNIIIYLWLVFTSADIEKIKSERIKIRRLHKQAELDRERARAQLRTVEELKYSYENKYMHESENIKIEYLKMDKLKRQTEVELQRLKKERSLIEELRPETNIKNTVDTRDYIKLQTENYRLQGLILQAEQQLQKTDAELKYIKDQHTDSKNIIASESAKIQAEYLKVEELKRMASDEIVAANVKRKAAMELFKKAEEKLSQANLTASNKHTSHNPYEILGVHPSDSNETIREIYKKLICIYHPDKHENLNLLSKKQKNDFMAKINSSYDLVTKQRSC
jgi:Ca2+/Na+ antiporter